ncbi:MAG TPA: TetR/AcrR family transcriptional regulator [Paracoccaceae bacterium]|nr:TetR/AcrR family transcriptional regulator [Paracoccaceae bacterium]
MSEAPARARARALEARERAILDAAAAVFAEAGYEGARMAEIGRRAGISEGAVYLHFRSKAALMAALVEDFWNELTRDARAAVAGAEGAAAKLRALADFHLGAVAERFDYMALAIRLAGPDETASVAWKRAYVAVFDGIVAEGRRSGAFGGAAPHWAVRDVFYGGLEYAGRSLRLRPEREPGAAAEAATAAALALLAPREGPTAKAGAEARLARAAERLERAAERLERAR